MRAVVVLFGEVLKSVEREAGKRARRRPLEASDGLEPGEREAGVRLVVAVILEKLTGNLERASSRAAGARCWNFSGNRINKGT